MAKSLRAAVSQEASPVFRLNLWAVPAVEREWVRVGAWVLLRAWLERLSRRGTLGYYRARHRPLAGPAPGARLPQ
ncbi:MAG TPA: hypothetical protein VFR00_01160 [Hyphomicrobiaceae bacterium]|jgi:hypothetical protein|nr:hypothetical protein [Hyphomicrobiaceae bacterium]